MPSSLLLFDMRQSLSIMVLLTFLSFPIVGIAATYDPCEETPASQDDNATVPEAFYKRRCAEHSRFEELQLKKKQAIADRNMRIKQRALEVFQKKYSKSTVRRTDIHKRVKTIEDENRTRLLDQNQKESQTFRSNKRRIIQEKDQEVQSKSINRSPSGLSKEQHQMCADLQGIRQQVCLRKLARGSR